MKNNLATTKKTEVVLAKGKSLLGITAKILSSSKALTPTQPHNDVTIIGDLMWEKEIQDWMTWDEAMEYAKNLRVGGYNDWRLPTIEELASIVKECGGINVTWGNDNWRSKADKNAANKSYQTNYKAKAFSLTHWSSTTDVNFPSRAWVVDFSYGYVDSNDKTNGWYVRCVR